MTLTGACVALTSEAGGACVNESDGGGGGVATMIVVAKAGFDGVVAAEDAVMMTAAPDGTVAGAV